MNNCPKCGSRDISGPHYRRLGWGGEALRYICNVCRFSRDEPTLDRARREGSDQS